MSQNNNNPSGQSSASPKHVLDGYTVQPQSSGESEDKSPYYKSAAPSISLPKGGGALKGIDEKFSVNAINGTAGLSVPLPFTPGRGGFTPGLSVSYSSGSGNSEFGLGWSLGLAGIQRKTDKKLPLYDDVHESDVFLLAGAEDLVPSFRNEEGDEDAFINVDGLLVKRYRPRIEGLFARIEFIRNRQQESWWRVTTKDNITTYYGLSAQSRLSEPDQPSHVFKWLPELVIDNKGNVQYYVYKQENLEEVMPTLHEKNRCNGRSLFSNLYLKRVFYCNKDAVYVSAENQYQPALPSGMEFLMEGLFDYGEHTDTGGIPSYEPQRPWPARRDPFSDFHAGFEIRTYRRCQRVLMYHHFDEIKVSNQPAIVRSVSFEWQGDEPTSATGYLEADYITRVIQTGYRYQKSTWRKKSLPAMTMHYQPLQWNSDLKEVSVADTRHAPQGLTGPYQWTDLWGEGLPGILTDQGQSWWYKSNLGDGHFSPAQPVAEKPSLLGLSGGGLQWQDLDADGNRQVVSRRAGLEGYFELGPSVGELNHQCWQKFTPFKHTANIDWNSPYTKMLDLNGDGKPDILLTHEQVWLWYENEGKDGFTTGGKVSTVVDEEKGPRLLLNDRVQSIFLADMNGDGMTDIVRIKNGEVCYWPNMGYGKFGTKVTMTNAPHFDRPDQFNPEYLQLADISGTGAADLIYIGHNTFRVWINLAGNAFADAHDIATLPGIEPYSKVALLDFLGNGTGCIVWSSPLPQHSHAPMRYIDLMSGLKPYLMNSYSNGMGKTVSVTYKSSSKFYLEDKAKGTPWATLLPFPVQCIDRITTHDAVSNTTFSQSYVYHHGYYDHEEREFRGFGRVDVTDIDQAIISANSHLDQAPVLTKTWYHTGAWLLEQTLLDAYAKEYYRFDGWNELPTQATFPASLTAQEQREAWRALKGSPLRQEVYALDGTAAEDNPYAVTVTSYQVKTIQKQGDNRFASFLVHGDQSLAYSCERQMEDTRLAHSLTLEVDEYGNVLRSAQIAYPRRNAYLPQVPATGDDVLKPVRDEQRKMHITCSVASFTNDIGHAPLPTGATPAPVPELTYRLRAPYESKGYELSLHVNDYLPEGQLWTPALLDAKIGQAVAVDYAAAPVDVLNTSAYTSPRLRLLSHSLSFFADDATLQDPLPAGTLSHLAIPYQQYTLALTKDILDQCFDGRVTTTMLGETEAGYVREDALPGSYSTDQTRWWLPSGRVYFTATPAADFYTPVQFGDPWDRPAAPTRSTVTFWTNAQGDNYWLLPQMVTDPLGNRSEVMAYDWFTLQPSLMKDANDNLSTISYDTLGMPVATAIMGKGTEADYLETLDAGQVALDAESASDLALQQSFWTTADPEAAAKQLLGKATWRCIYNLNSQPTAVAMIGREQHFEDNATSNVVIRVTYTDGFGREALSKAQVEPTAVTLDSLHSFTAHWVCSGKTIYNNKGAAVMQYEPFFCYDHTFDDDQYMAEVGVSPKVHYDPLGRAIRTDLPDGTYTYTTWDNWSQTVYDANDTTGTGNPWYDAMQAGTGEQQDAADKALAHAGTPSVMHLDSLARPFFTIQQHRQVDAAHPDPFYRSYVTQDIAGNRLAVHDAMGKVPLTYAYNMLNAPCWQHSVDGGTGRIFLDVAGQPLYSWDTDDRMTHVAYDRKRRPVATYMTVGAMTKMISKTVYADGPSASAALNLRGAVLESYDAGGKHSVDGYDFKGLPLHSYTQLLADATITEVDWSTGAAPALSTEVFTATAVMDALGRPVTTTDPGGNISRYTYDKGGMLKSVWLKPADPAKAEAPYVQDIHYDAKGQRQAIWYGNGTKTSYRYDPQTYRLTRMFTVKISGNTMVQDLYYWYDAVGNITLIRDEVQSVIFHDNTLISPDLEYTYDALYRLIKAKGRERKANSRTAGSENTNDDAMSQDAAAPFDGNALQNYTQQYTYDGVGNILSLQHTASVGSYTRTFTYGTVSNQLQSTTVGSDTFNYTHDSRGNMDVMSHLSVMDWNNQNQLGHIVAGSTEAYYQYSGGQRVRKVLLKSGGREERIYLGSFEIYRKFDSTSSLTLERTTVHVGDDAGRIAMLEVKTVDTAGDPSPEFLNRFIYSNHLQSASLELNDSGEIISYEEYHPYGTTAYQAKSSPIHAAAKRYRYTGKERDDESGFNYHGARYYALWLCRWVSMEPRINKYPFKSSYLYCSDNPVNRIDPDGKDDIHFYSFSVIAYVPNGYGGRVKSIIQQVNWVSVIKNNEPNTFTVHHDGYELNPETGKRENDFRTERTLSRWGREAGQYLATNINAIRRHYPNVITTQGRFTQADANRLDIYARINNYISEKKEWENRTEGFILILDILTLGDSGLLLEGLMSKGVTEILGSQAAKKGIVSIEELSLNKLRSGGISNISVKGSAVIDAEFSENIVYRVIRREENIELGLVAKNPNAKYSAAFHVSRGSKFDTQFISTTKDIKVAEEWAERIGNRIVKIDLSKVKGEIYDLTIPKVRDQYLKHPISKNLATKSKEVLIKGVVPKGAICPVNF